MFRAAVLFAQRPEDVRAFAKQGRATLRGGETCQVCSAKA